MRKHMHLILVVVFCGCTPGSTSEPELLTMLHEQMEIHPALHLEDVYKLLYQGSLGIEHLLTDTLAAKQYLDDEWREIPAAGEEPLIEVISPDSQWVRLNLKPYKAAAGNTETVWRAMLRSAKVTAPREVFLQRWQAFMSLVDEKRLFFDANEVHGFDEKMARAAYRASHHSSDYLERYKPAYRVLVLSEARKLANAVGVKNPF
jgi:hypothetical protein